MWVKVMEEKQFDAWRNLKRCQDVWTALGMQNTVGLTDEERCELDIRYREATDAFYAAVSRFRELCGPAERTALMFGG